VGLWTARATQGEIRMRILCVHQGYELYGSDRSFIASVETLRRTFPEDDVETIIPADGPIAPYLRRASNRLLVEPLWVIRRRHLLKLVALSWVTLPASVIRAVMKFRRSDLVYINTVVLCDYLLVARFFRKKAILHVHEIPTGLAGAVLRFLVRSAKVRTIYNSHATRRAYRPSRKARSHVLYNGCNGPSSAQPPDYDQTRQLRVLMLGRLNSWKGQDVLVEACGCLPPEIRAHLDIRIVGSSFESDVATEEKLGRLIGERGCSGCISFEPFSEDPARWYDWCDLVVVPSKLPEPFGRVPIEAMSFGRGAIVSALGGLVETVEDGITGRHVPANNPAALSQALAKAISMPKAINEWGRQARQKYELCFRQEIVDREFASIVLAQVRDATAASIQEIPTGPARSPG
jgi:glycosyltransferase involved in cell wall biosynthesis